MINPKQQLLQEIETLPTELVTQALYLIHTLKSNIGEHQRNLTFDNKKADFIRSLRGKYAYVQTSSDHFAQRKQVEIDWEDRNR
jgi:hypothetical protein